MAEQENDPFKGFNLLQTGVIQSNDDESQEVDEIETGLEGEIIENEDLGDNQSVADKALDEVVKKQSKASKKKEEVEDEESVEDESEVTDEQSEEGGFKSALTHFLDKGILDFDEASIEDSEEGFEKAVDQTVKKKFEKLLNDKLGEDGLALLSFVESGGNPKQFYEAYYNNNSWEDYDITDNEAAQKIVVRESLISDGYEAEEVEDMIKEFDENGTLEKRSKTHLAKLQKQEANYKKELVEQQKVQAEKRKVEEKKYWDEFKSNLLSKEDIQGFKLSPKVKEDLYNYMTVVDKKTGKTAYQKSVEENSDSAYLFAYFSMKKFDISKLEKQVTTKAASKLNGLMKNYQPSSRDRLSTGITDTNNNGDDPFAGFKKIK